MTAPDSTPDSRTTATAGQAAYEAHRTVVAVSLGLDLDGADDFDGPPAAWEKLAPSGHAAWEAAATAAIAAAAPAPAGELSAPDPLDGAMVECGASHCPPSMHTDCEWPKCATVITPQPQAAPDLTARLAAVTALLDASHKRDWDSGLAGERKRVTAEREAHGMGAL